MENEVLIQLLTDIKSELARLNQTATQIKGHCDRADRAAERELAVEQLRRLTGHCNELAKDYKHYAQALVDITSDDFMKAHLADIYHGQFADKYGRELNEEALAFIGSKVKEATARREKLVAEMKEKYPELVLHVAVPDQEPPARDHKEEDK